MTLATDVLVPQVVDRGDGTTYRARKPPEAIAVRLCGYGRGILVLRCHDLDVAHVATFAALLARAEGGRVRVSRTEFAAWEAGVAGVPLWVRYVPDEYPPGPDTGGSWERELRGTAGATPAVLFADEVDAPSPGEIGAF